MPTPEIENKEYKKFLDWLWKGAVKLVLVDLGYHGGSLAKDLPRVHWVGTGFASSYPFHAAGILPEKRKIWTESTFDRVVSSYTSSIKALAYAQERVYTQIEPGQPTKVLLVTMPDTPGHPLLANVDVEVNGVENTVDKTVQNTKDETTDSL